MNGGLRDTVVRAAAILLAAGLVAGCATSATVTPAPTPVASAGDAAATPRMPGERVELVVFAAASLKDALQKAAAAYEAQHRDVEIVLSTDSSAALRAQIEQGAPADVFLAADATQPRRLVDAGLARGRDVVFAENELAVVVPAANPAQLASPADLARPGVKIVAAGDEVPITAYAERLAGNLSKIAGYPSDFADAYLANVVSREDNVRAVLAKIELGEGDAAIVYATDARASDGVETLPLPAGANVRASYAGVVVESTGHPDAADAFLAWLSGPGGQAALATFGFLPPAS